MADVCSFPNVKTSAYKKGPEMFDQWCRTNQVHAEALPLLKQMLQLDPAKRISALDASLVGFLAGLAGRGRDGGVEGAWGALMPTAGGVLLAAGCQPSARCCWQSIPLSEPVQ